MFRNLITSALVATAAIIATAVANWRAERRSVAVLQATIADELERHREVERRRVCLACGRPKHQ